MAEPKNRHIFLNAGPIAHFSAGDLSKPLVGVEMSSSNQLHPAGYGFVVESGCFVKIAPTEEIISEYGGDVQFTNLNGRAIIPGFVDAHTHLCGMVTVQTK